MKNYDFQRPEGRAFLPATLLLAAALMPLLLPLLLLPTDDPASLLARLSTTSSSSILPLPSNTPWMSDIVLSRLLLLLLGLVIVVPKLACLECPLLNPPGDVAIGLPGDGIGEGDPEAPEPEDEVLMRDKGGAPRAAMTFSMLSLTPLGEIGGGPRTRLEW